MPRFVGGWEWIIILVIVVIIFGVGRLPEIGGALGKSIRDFKKGMQVGEEEEAEAEPAKAKSKTSDE
jgi:sec-independent protein translocase protein TatA